jgi:putative ABC transport system permease protein
MPDWEAYVRERLPVLQVSPEREVEIVQELAQELEQSYAEAITGGSSDAEAFQTAQAHIADWHALAGEINSAERAVQPVLTTNGPSRPVSGIKKDVVYAFRGLRKNPAFAAIAVLTLAFGIGANTAIFTVANTVAFRPLPCTNSDQLVTVETRKSREPELEPWSSAPDLFSLRERTRALSAIAGISPVWNLVMSGRGAADRIECLFVSAEFFPMLGVKPVLGRGFLPDEDTGIHGANVVILSHSLWQSRFGASAAVLDEKLILDGRAYSVVGVLPSGFRYPGEPLAGRAADVDMWLPLASNSLISGRRDLRFLKLIARRQSGNTLEQANNEIRGIGAALTSEYPDTNRGFEIGVHSLASQVTRHIRPALYLLLSAVGLVLLLACANVANLVLARTASRQKEISIRVALGASRARLIRQLFTEGLVLAVAGGMAGILLAQWMLKLLVATSPVGLIPREAIAMDGFALVFTMCLVLLSALLSSIPIGFALCDPRLMRPELAQALKEHGRGLAGGNAGVRSALVAAQMALALILVLGAGLLIRSFIRLLHVDPGFQAGNLVTISSLMPPTARKPEQRAAIYRAMSERIASIPGVRSVAAVSRLPLMGSNLASWLNIEGRRFAGDQKPDIEYRVATPSYFQTMGIPLIKGRLFDEQDNVRAGDVVLINQTTAQRFWPNEDPIGKRIKFGSDVDKLPWITIVGVVGSSRHFGLDAEPRPEAYRPYGFNPLVSPILVIRTAGDPGPIIPELTSAIHVATPDVAAYNVFRMEQLMARSTAERRFVMWLLTAFGAAAMFLAAVGIYGVASQSVVQRTQEIGLRLALGASPGKVQAMILRDGLRLTAIGGVIGLVAAAAFARLMNSLLFGVSPFDLAVFSMGPLVLGAVALVACLAPAVRATRVDPLVALRHD